MDRRIKFSEITTELRARIPLIQEENLALLNELSSHETSPNWNYECGDRVTQLDLKPINEFAEELFLKRDFNIESPNEKIIEFLNRNNNYSSYFSRTLTRIDIEKNFSLISIMKREDIAKRLVDIVPYSADLSRVIVNPTSGTTGHSILCPNHPLTIACYSHMILYALEKNHIHLNLNSKEAGVMMVSFQEKTAMYSTVKPYMKGSGFSKLNLNPNVWRDKTHPSSYLNFFKPELITGNPISLQELLNLSLSFSPKAILSTSMELSVELKHELEKKLNTKVINFYSLNETGPIGFSDTDDPNLFSILPHDLFLEVTDEEGYSLNLGEVGNLTITCFRNPFLPLLRYATGDKAKLIKDESGSLKFMLLDSRKPVLYKTPSGKKVNPIDINQIIRRYPILKHQIEVLSQDKIQFKLETESGLIYFFDNLKEDLVALFNEEVEIEIL
ncbi:MAG: hypothetical protein SFU98_06040 [Leptospiraceae bacterium]|nr:hypothetical protein [Leptospiraceae bacterium]